MGNEHTEVVAETLNFLLQMNAVGVATKPNITNQHQLDKMPAEPQNPKDPP